MPMINRFPPIAEAPIADCNKRVTIIVRIKGVKKHSKYNYLLYHPIQLIPDGTLLVQLFKHQHGDAN